MITAARPPQVPDDRGERTRVANLHPTAWSNPTPPDCYQLVVIGGGTAGIAAAQRAAALGARVALVERHLLGGTCLNTGCVPSRALIRTSRLYAEMRDATRYGACRPADIKVDFAATMARVRAIRGHLSGDLSVRTLAAAGVDVYFGRPRFTGADSLTVDDTPLRFARAIIATGARPHVPDIPGLKEAGFLTNETVFDLTELPRRLLVIGGGPIGCELAQAFRRLGAGTTIVQSLPLFLEREERDAAQMLSDAMARDGVEVRLNTHVVAVRVENGQKLVDLVSDDYHNTIAVDAIAAGVGRTPNVEGMNLDAAGVAYAPGQGVAVDDHLRTSNPRIYAAGDVCLNYKYGHTAQASAQIAVANALFRGHRRVSELVIPWCTFTDPEIAHVGLYVRQANQRGIPVKTYTVLMHQVDRAVADSETAGFVKIHVREGSDHILGATIVARHAGDMINEITLAMGAGVGLRKIADVIHCYDTQAEAIQMAAKACERTRLTPRVRARLKHWLAHVCAG